MLCENGNFSVLCFCQVINAVLLYSDISLVNLFLLAWLFIIVKNFLYVTLVNLIVYYRLLNYFINMMVTTLLILLYLREFFLPSHNNSCFLVNILTTVIYFPGFHSNSFQKMVWNF